VYVLWLRFGLALPFCDDALITMSAVRNFAEGDGLWFDPRQRVQIVTGPLWAFPVATLRAVGMDVLKSATFFGAVFDVTMVLVITHLGRLLSGWTGVGVIAAVLAAMNPHITLLSSFRGMETTLSLTVIVAAFVAFYLRRNALALLLGVVAVMARFDGLLALGCVGLAFLYRRRRELFTGTTLRELAPASVLALVYGGVGWWFAASPIPWSVERKSSIASPEMWSEKWVESATKLANKFGEASVGIVPLHTRFDQPSDWTQLGIDVAYWMALPALIGVITLLWKRQAQWLPAVGYGLFFAAVFIVSGKVYALHSPWYFAPTACIFTLLAAYGVVVSLQFLLARVAPGRGDGLLNGVCLVFAVGLIVLHQARLDHSAAVVHKFSLKRERSYASVAAWFGENVDEEGFIVSNEIGTIGFWARPEHETLDAFGLSRRYEERKMGFGALVEAHQPIGAIMLKHFEYHRRTMDKRAPDQYTWHEWKRLVIGVRKDLTLKTEFTTDNLDAIHRDISMNREYAWMGTP
jgi:hypothetical protein